MNRATNLSACIRFLTAVLLLAQSTRAFNPSPTQRTRINPQRIATSSLNEQTCDWDKVTEDWELDCYSRPVLVDGKKKLWEILMTDSSGSMKICRALPSNKWVYACWFWWKSSDWGAAGDLMVSLTMMISDFFCYVHVQGELTRSTQSCGGDYWRKWSKT
jgi:hypothetical protein